MTNDQKNDNNSYIHACFMKETINIAKHNIAAPYGAIIVIDNKDIVAASYNTSKENPIMHGELAVIEQYFKNENRNDTNKISLYTTGEPCPMCMSAIYWSRITKVIYGSSIPFLHSLFKTQINIRASEILEKTPPFFKCELIGGVLEEECNQLFIQAMNIQNLSLTI